MTIVDQIEAVLFVADSPLSTQSLARAVDGTEGQVDQALEVLQQRYGERGALQIVQLAGGFQLSTKPLHAELIGAFLKPQRSKLSRSLLEVLAIVAYKQPVTMAEVEGIRGVQSDYAIRGLLDRRLVREVGRKPTPGRPILLGTTKQFLHQFHLNDLSELPAIDDSMLVRAASTGERSLFEPETHEVH